MTVGNPERADSALCAVQEFRDVCGGTDLDAKGGMEEAIGDLIGNLCHLAERHGIDPVAIIQHGICHYAVERIERDGMAYEARATLEIEARLYNTRADWEPFTAANVKRWRAALRKEWTKEFGAEFAREQLG